MGSSSPLVCHSCWDSRDNWSEPCPHAMEVFQQGERKGVLAGKPIPLDPIELPAVLLEWSSNSMSAHRLVAHAGFARLCGDETAEPKFELEKREGTDQTGAEVWLKVKDESGTSALLAAAVLALRNAGVLPVRAIEAAALTELKARKQVIECPRCGVKCEIAFETKTSEKSGCILEVAVGWTCSNCGVVSRCRACDGSGTTIAKVGHLRVNRICPECQGHGDGDPAEIEDGQAQEG